MLDYNKEFLKVLKAGVDGVKESASSDQEKMEAVIQYISRMFKGEFEHDVIGRFAVLSSFTSPSEYVVSENTHTAIEQHLNHFIDYYLQVTHSTKERLEGIAWSLCTLLDGVAGMSFEIIGFKLIVVIDKNGILLETDLSGSLHECFHEVFRKNKELGERNV